MDFPIKETYLSKSKKRTGYFEEIAV